MRRLGFAVLLSASLVLGGCIYTSPIRAAASCTAKLQGDADRIDLAFAAPDGRNIPVSLFHPTAPGSYPLIVFSHGAYAAPGRYAAMLTPYAAAGYVVIAPMHVDSEVFPRGDAPPPSPEETWATRHEDFALAFAVPTEARGALEARGIAVDTGATVAIGHSYGALIAQIAGGARATEGDGTQPDRSIAGVDALVGWAPPGPFPGRMAAQGWSFTHAPSLTITGTSDILPGFIDDWRLHATSFDYAPSGTARLWVGEGIDHYFGGMFGREAAADEHSRRLFHRAMAQSLGFIEAELAQANACTPGALTNGESLAAN